LRFVLNKIAKLAEGPRGDHAVKALGTSHPVSNSIERFQGNYGIRVLRRDVYQLTTDFVVHIAHPIALLALHGSHAVSAPVVLVPTSQACEVLAAVTNGLPVPNLHSVWRFGHSQSSYAQIHADDGGFTVAVTDGRRAGHLEREHCVPVLASFEKASIAAYVWQIGPPAGRDTEWQPDILSPSISRDPQVRSHHAIGGSSQSYPLAAHGGGLACFSLRFAQSEVAPGKLHSVVDRHASILGGQAQGPYLPVGSGMNSSPGTGSVLKAEIKRHLRRFAEQLSGLI
jgi:hypothetical protein